MTFLARGTNIADEEEEEGEEEEEEEEEEGEGKAVLWHINFQDMPRERFAKA